MVKATLAYHAIFDYPLTAEEIERWQPGRKFPAISHQGYCPAISREGRYYFLKGWAGIVDERRKREKYAKRKLVIARRAARLLAKIPTIKLVAVTGALAMGNAKKESDIDLLLIAQRGTLWTTRLISYLVTSLVGIKTRKPGDREEKDKLCLNIWLDETDLLWRKKNVYTAHEIAQIVPLIDKQKTYEKFIQKNSWIFDYWPEAVTSDRLQVTRKSPAPPDLVTCYLLLFALLEPLAFKMQYAYMRRKITKETIAPTRALFHPVDWSRKVEKQFVRRFPIGSR